MTKASKMKYAVIIFHKNVHNYPPQWIERCVTSIKNQTFHDFDVFELDYGNENNMIYPDAEFVSYSLANHAEAHNALLDIVFDDGYDYAFNVNVDDYYALDRFEKQVAYAERGYDVISSNFYNIDANDNILKEMKMSDKNMLLEARREHNILAHPVMCYSRNFWLTCSKLWGEQIPKDDFELWKRSYEKYKFVILPDFLLYYRIHPGKTKAR